MLKPSDRTAIVSELMKHLGVTDKQNTVKNFLGTLADNNRLGLLEGVCSKFEDLMSAWNQEVELTVTSASVCLLVPAIMATQAHQLILDVQCSLSTIRPSPDWNRQSQNPNTLGRARS
jgi:hypothetical protein